MMSVIEVKNICKVFGHKQKENQAMQLLRKYASKAQVLAETGCNVGLDDVSLNIQEGEIFVIMGLSGSGKSTLVRHFNRLIEPSAGEILFRGRDVLKFSEKELLHLRRYRMSMVFQSFGLLPHVTVLDNASYGLRLRGETQAQAHEKGRLWLERVGLKGYEGCFPDELSGGMRQRVGLARALATDCEVLLMDEAFSALDPLIRHEMQDQLLTLQSQLQKTIVFITHDIDEALRIGSRIAILKDGALIQVGTPEDIVQRPIDDYVRRFITKSGTDVVLTSNSSSHPIA